MCISTINYTFDFIRLHEAIVSKQQDLVLLRGHCVRPCKEAVDAHLKNVPVLKKSEGVLADDRLAVVTTYDVHPDLVDFLEDLFLTQFVFLLTRRVSQAAGSRHSVRRQISSFVFDFLASEFNHWVVNGVPGDHVHDPLVLFICANRFLSLLRVIEQVTHLQSGSFRGRTWLHLPVPANLSIIKARSVRQILSFGLRDYRESRHV